VRRIAALSGLVLAAAGALAGAAPPPPSAPREPAVPDLLFFASKAALDLHVACASCHAYSETAGRFLLQPYENIHRPEPERVLANYRAALRFLDAEEPRQSPLLRKALGEGNHGGGVVFAKRSAKEVETLLDFALGATTRNVAPDAIVAQRTQGAAGAPIELDGSLSADRDGDEIGFRWSLVDRPEGSAASLAGADAVRATLTADSAGAYRVELSVHDGKLWSVPESTLVLVSGGGPRAPSRTGAGTGAPSAGPSALTERLDPRRLRFLRRLFMDLVDRGPTLDEIQALYPRTSAEIVDALLADPETWRAWYERQLYYFLLLDRFRPKDSPLASLPDRLLKGETPAMRALEEIVRSQFFSQRNPGNDTFVTVVLEQCLGMVVQKNLPVLEAGKKMYDGYRTKLLGDTGDSQADVVRIVFAQAAAAEHLLARTWKELFGAEGDRKLLQAAALRLRAEPQAFPAVLREWLLGPAYAAAVDRARTKPEIPYVRALFLDVVGRLPAYDELRNVRNAFLSLADPTPIRLVMVRVLLESREAAVPASAADPERFVREQFVRLLARPPSPKERDAFVAALRSDSLVTPRLVLWTILSSAEYQSY